MIPQLKPLHPNAPKLEYTLRQLSTSLFALAFFFIFTSSATAESVCLVGRSSGDPTSGHAFVYVSNGNSIIESYGYWPKSKNPQYLAINRVALGRKGIQKSGDLPYAWLRAHGYKFNESSANLTEDQFCLEVGRADLENARAIARGYFQSFGPYKSLSNNCTHFAIRQFNAMTGANLKVIVTPLALRKVLRKLNAQQLEGGY